MDTYDFLSDPRTLTMAERHAACEQYKPEQTQWLHKLQELAEEPKPNEDFPAFLLAMQPFADLARRLSTADTRQQMPTDLADELDWFVRAFANYMRSQEGEEVFPETPGLTG